MEVNHNGTRPQSTGQLLTNSPADGADKGKKSKKDRTSKWVSLKGASVLLLIAITILLVAVIAYVAVNSGNNEDSLVNKSAYQAVFVNVTGSSGGQAYFGHIDALNSKYIQLTSVFYLEPGSSNNQFTLNNLSCALYNPTDTMTINRDQVAFWENLKSNSQVTTDINKWFTDKLQCSSSNSGTAASGSTATGTTTTPSTTTKP